MSNGSKEGSNQDGYDYVKPSHYQGSKFEVADIWDKYDMNRYLALALKHIARNGKKPNQPPILDADKAIWYLERYRKKCLFQQRKCKVSPKQLDEIIVEFRITDDCLADATVEIFNIVSNKTATETLHLSVALEHLNLFIEQQHEKAADFVEIIEETEHEPETTTNAKPTTTTEKAANNESL